MTTRTLCFALVTVFALSAASCKKKARQSGHPQTDTAGRSQQPAPPVLDRGKASYELDITGAHRVHAAGSGATVRTIAGTEYINLTSDDGTVNLAISGKGPIEVGTLQLGGTPAAWQASIELPGEAKRPVFTSKAGTVVISRLDGDSIAGTFEMVAAGKTDSTVEIEASGRFTARRK